MKRLFRWLLLPLLNELISNELTKRELQKKQRDEEKALERAKFISDLATELNSSDALISRAETYLVAAIENRLTADPKSFTTIIDKLKVYKGLIDARLELLSLLPF